MNKRPMTRRGYNAIREELTKLKAQRPELARAIEVARAQGDLSENADYDAAKNRSGMIEARIRDCESKLATADVIEPQRLRGATRVMVGMSVRVEELSSGEERVITIVGADESDVSRGYISFEAPMGRAFIGKEVGDVARVELAGGAREFELRELFIDESLYEESA